MGGGGRGVFQLRGRSTHKRPFVWAVTGTGTMVNDGFPLGLVWFQDTSLVAVALLCRRYCLISRWFMFGFGTRGCASPWSCFGSSS